MAKIDLASFGLEPIVDLESFGLTPTNKNVIPPNRSTDQAVGALLSPASSPRANMPRMPQMQEKYSNPTIMKGFQNLPKQAQKQAIMDSQMDPANQSPVGTFVPPGTYESDPARMLATTAPLMAMPEIGMGEGIFSRYVAEPIANSLARMGGGTASDIAYNAPNIQDKSDLAKVGKHGLINNALLEAGTAPFRIPSYFGEMFNPLKYATGKANQIRQEYQATKATTDEMYRPVNEKYNGVNVTSTPDQYMKTAGIDRADLYPDAKIVYDHFLAEPTFANLHNLQSKLGKDWARISTHPATAEKAQLFAQMRDSLKQNVETFLSRDPAALQQYNLASEYAKNSHYPYLATPTLRNIAKGNVEVQPKRLSKSIDQATRKTMGNTDRSMIPEAHPLRNHLADLNKMTQFGEAAQYAIPAILGGIGGEILHPGLGGIIGGGATALGASQMSSMASKFGAPNMTNFVQNPLVERLFNRTAPWWYGAGRAGINASYSNGRK